MTVQRARPPAPPRVGFVSLGCPKALVDSEQILTQLKAEGYAIAPTYEGAELVVVNTCGFIDCGGRRIARRDRRGARRERQGDRHRLPRREGRRRLRARRAPEGARGHRPARDRRGDVGGARAPAEAARPVRRPRPAAGDPAHAEALRVPEDQRGLQPPLHVLHHPVDARRPRVAPDRRGARRGAQPAAAGVKELLVISQDTSAYGVDVRYRTGFVDGRPVRTRMTELVRELDRLARDHGAWVRLHYVYPYPHVDEVIALMRDDAAQGGLVPYLDVPFQHASPRILKLMKRPAAPERVLERVRAWRKAQARPHDPQHVHRRLPRRDRRRVRRAARVPRRGRARPRRLLRLLAGRGRRGERAARTGRPATCARRAARASWRRRRRSARGGSRRRSDARSTRSSTRHETTGRGAGKRAIGAGAQHRGRARDRRRRAHRGRRATLAAGHDRRASTITGRRRARPARSRRRRRERRRARLSGRSTQRAFRGEVARELGEDLAERRALRGRRRSPRSARSASSGDGTPSTTPGPAPRSVRDT